MLSELSSPTREEREFLFLLRIMGAVGLTVLGTEMRARAQRLAARGFIELYIADSGDERARITSKGSARCAAEGVT